MFTTIEDYNAIPYNLTNLKGPESLEAEFNQFITDNEENTLRKLFGSLFWNAFKAGVAALPETFSTETAYLTGVSVTYGANIFTALVDVPDTNVAVPVNGGTWAIQPASRWLVLREGATYTYNYREYNWVGMRKLCVPLIYSLWVESVTDNPSGAGIVTLDTENASVTSPAIRIARGANLFAQFAGGDRGSNGWEYVDDTLYGYLFTNSTVFDDLVASIPIYSSFLVYLSQEFCNPGGRNIFDL